MKYNTFTALANTRLPWLIPSKAFLGPTTTDSFERRSARDKLLNLSSHDDTAATFAVESAFAAAGSAQI